ncbi:MAG: hypothetical protein ACYCVN_01335 [Acidimicrobiales bacterium]
MGLADNLRASAEAGLAKATEVANTGQAKLDAVQAKRRADGLLHDLGAAIWAERCARVTEADNAKRVDSIAKDLERYESDYGPLPS